MTRFSIIAASILVFASPAHAHLGHVGEVAGHSHVLGWAALAGAAAIAVALAALRARDEADAEDEEGEEKEDAAEQGA